MRGTNLVIPEYFVKAGYFIWYGGKNLHWNIEKQVSMPLFTMCCQLLLKGINSKCLNLKALTF